MSVHAGAGKLSLAFKTLRHRWDDVHGRWNDPVSLAFEEQVFAPLEYQIIATLRETDRLAQALARARQDCEERSY